MATRQGRSKQSQVATTDFANVVAATVAPVGQAESEANFRETVQDQTGSAQELSAPENSACAGALVRPLTSNNDAIEGREFSVKHENQIKSRLQPWALANLGFVDKSFMKLAKISISPNISPISTISQLSSTDSHLTPIREKNLEKWFNFKKTESEDVGRSTNNLLALTFEDKENSAYKPKLESGFEISTTNKTLVELRKRRAALKLKLSRQNAELSSTEKAETAFQSSGNGSPKLGATIKTESKPLFQTAFESANNGSNELGSMKRAESGHHFQPALHSSDSGSMAAQRGGAIHSCLVHSQYEEEGAHEGGGPSAAALKTEDNVLGHSLTAVSALQHHQDSSGTLAAQLSLGSSKAACAPGDQIETQERFSDIGGQRADFPTLVRAPGQAHPHLTQGQEQPSKPGRLETIFAGRARDPKPNSYFCQDFPKKNEKTSVSHDVHTKNHNKLHDPFQDKVNKLGDSDLKLDSSVPPMVETNFKHLGTDSTTIALQSMRPHCIENSKLINEYEKALNLREERDFFHRKSSLLESGDTNEPPGTNSNIPSIDEPKLVGTTESLGPFDDIHQGLSQKTNKFSESGDTNKPPGTNSSIPRMGRAKLAGTIENLGPFDDTHQGSIHEMNKRSEGGKMTGNFDLPRYFSDAGAVSGMRSISKISNTDQAKMSGKFDSLTHFHDEGAVSGMGSISKFSNTDQAKLSGNFDLHTCLSDDPSVEDPNITVAGNLESGGNATAKCNIVTPRNFSEGDGNAFTNCNIGTRHNFLDGDGDSVVNIRDAPSVRQPGSTQRPTGTYLGPLNDETRFSETQETAKGYYHDLHQPPPSKEPFTTEDVINTCFNTATVVVDNSGMLQVPLRDVHNVIQTGINDHLRVIRQSPSRIGKSLGILALEDIIERNRDVTKVSTFNKTTFIGIVKLKEENIFDTRQFSMACMDFFITPTMVRRHTTGELMTYAYEIGTHRNRIIDMCPQDNVDLHYDYYLEHRRLHETTRNRFSERTDKPGNANTTENKTSPPPARRQPANQAPQNNPQLPLSNGVASIIQTIRDHELQTRDWQYTDIGETNKMHWPRPPEWKDATLHRHFRPSSEQGTHHNGNSDDPDQTTGEINNSEDNLTMKLFGDLRHNAGENNGHNGHGETELSIARNDLITHTHKQLPGYVCGMSKNLQDLWTKVVSLTDIAITKGHINSDNTRDNTAARGEITIDSGIPTQLLFHSSGIVVNPTIQNGRVLYVDHPLEKAYPASAQTNIETLTELHLGPESLDSPTPRPDQSPTMGEVLDETSPEEAPQQKTTDTKQMGEVVKLTTIIPGEKIKQPPRPTPMPRITRLRNIMLRARTTEREIKVTMANDSFASINNTEITSDNMENEIYPRPPITGPPRHLSTFDSTDTDTADDFVSASEQPTNTGRSIILHDQETTAHVTEPWQGAYQSKPTRPPSMMDRIKRHKPANKGTTTLPFTHSGAQTYRVIKTSPSSSDSNKTFSSDNTSDGQDDKSLEPRCSTTPILQQPRLTFESRHKDQINVEDLIKGLQHARVTSDKSSIITPEGSYIEDSLAQCSGLPGPGETTVATVTLTGNATIHNRQGPKRETADNHTQGAATQTVAHLNVLTAKELDMKETALKGHTTLNTEVFKKFNELRRQYQLSLTNLQSNQLQIRLINAQPIANRGDMQRLMGDAKLMQEQLLSQLNETEEAIDKLLTTPNTFHPIDIVEPRYGTTNNIQPDQLRMVPDFEPAKSGLKLYQVANKLIPILNVQNLQEQSFKDCLYSKIKDAGALEAYEVYKEKRFLDIVHLLSGQFDKPHRRTDYVNDLLKFKPKEEESLTNTIHRLRLILTCIEKDKPGDEQKMRIDLKLKEKLHDILPPQIWRQVRSTYRDQEQLGHIMSTAEIIDCCLRVHDNSDFDNPMRPSNHNLSVAEVTGYLMNTKLETPPPPKISETLSRDRATRVPFGSTRTRSQSPRHHPYKERERSPPRSNTPKGEERGRTLYPGTRGQQGQPGTPSLIVGNPNSGARPRSLGRYRSQSRNANRHDRSPPNADNNGNRQTGQNSDTQNPRDNPRDQPHQQANNNQQGDRQSSRPQREQTPETQQQPMDQDRPTLWPGQQDLREHLNRNRSQDLRDHLNNRQERYNYTDRPRQPQTNNQWNQKRPAIQCKYCGAAHHETFCDRPPTPPTTSPDHRCGECYTCQKFGKQAYYCDRNKLQKLLWIQNRTKERRADGPYNRHPRPPTPPRNSSSQRYYPQNLDREVHQHISLPRHPFQLKQTIGRHN